MAWQLYRPIRVQINWSAHNDNYRFSELSIYMSFNFQVQAQLSWQNKEQKNKELWEWITDKNSITTESNPWLLHFDYVLKKRYNYILLFIQTISPILIG